MKNDIIFGGTFPNKTWPTQMPTLRKFERGELVTCNGNPEGRVLGYYSNGSVEVRLWQGFRHVGDTLIPVSDLIRENPSKAKP